MFLEIDYILMDLDGIVLCQSIFLHFYYFSFHLVYQWLNKDEEFNAYIYSYSLPTQVLLKEHKELTWIFLF